MEIIKFIIHFLLFSRLLLLISIRHGINSRRHGTGLATYLSTSYTPSFVKKKKKKKKYCNKR